MTVTVTNGDEGNSSLDTAVEIYKKLLVEVGLSIVDQGTYKSSIIELFSDGSGDKVPEAGMDGGVASVELAEVFSAARPKKKGSPRGLPLKRVEEFRFRS